MAQIEVLEKQLEGVTLEQAAPPEDTPETAQFRALPQELQRRLLVDYPRILATAMLQYSGGSDCESVLMQVFEGSPEMLRVRNTHGDTPMAVALLQAQDERAEKLVDLAHRRNPAALDSRSQFGESLLMLATSSSSAASLMGRLLQRDPTQLHRLYDLDGRNFLHHCALEDSAEALDAALQLTEVLIREGRLSASQVSAAIHMNDRSGDTPMHTMAARNRRDMLSRLLQFGRDAGIDINVDERQHRDRRQTPLMVAVRAGAAEAAELLVSRGADPTEEDAEGQTALDMAAGNAQISGVLGVEEDAEGQTALDMAVGNAQISRVLGVEEERMDVTELGHHDAADSGKESWLTKGQQTVPSMDSGIGSAPGSVWSTTVESVASVSSAELAALTRSLSREKSLLFLRALSRRDFRLNAVDIACVSADPVTVAFSCWESLGARVPRPLVLAALSEVENS